MHQVSICSTDGSAVKAGHNVLLAADDEIDLLAGRSTPDQKSTNSSADV